MTPLPVESGRAAVPAGHPESPSAARAAVRPARGRRPRAAGLAALALLAGATACSGGDDGGGDSGTTSSAPAPGTTASAVPDAAGAGARADLVGAICDSDKGSWSLRGTLRNPDDRPARYTVTADVAETVGGGVHGAKELVVVVDPHAEKSVEARDFVTDAAPGLACTIGVRKSPA